MRVKWRLAPRWAALVTVFVVAVAWCGVRAVPALASGPFYGVEGTTLGGPSSPLGFETFSNSVTYVTIDWGDGNASTCFRATNTPPPADSFCYWMFAGEFNESLWGWHTYHLAGHYTLTLKQYDANNSLLETDYDNAYIQDAPLTPQGTTSNTLVGAASSAVVGHFTDGNAFATDPHAYSAAINWGDGTPIDTNTVISGTGGSAGFIVSGTHNYAAPSSAGGYSVTVSIAEEQGSTATISSHVIATLTGSQSVTVQEGTPFSGVVAQYCGTTHPVASATVDWGDGSGSDTNTAISQDTYMGATCYQIVGTHTYAVTAAQPYQTTITPDAGSDASAVTGVMTVTDAPLSSSLDANFLAANSLSIPSSVIAHVKDGNTLGASLQSGRSVRSERADQLGRRLSRSGRHHHGRPERRRRRRRRASPVRGPGLLHRHRLGRRLRRGMHRSRVRPTRSPRHRSRGWSARTLFPRSARRPVCTVRAWRRHASELGDLQR